MLAFATVALAAAALAGTTDVIVLSAHAAGSPIEWPGLGTALGPAAALSLVVVCARPVTAREPGQSEPRARSVFAEGALDALVLGLTAALATAVLFGGTGGAEPAATLAFVVRAVVVAVGIAVARPTLCVLPRPALATLGVASAGLSALGAYFAVAEPLDPSQRTALAETIGIALVLALGMSVVPRHRAPLPLEQELEL